MNEQERNDAIGRVEAGTDALNAKADDQGRSLHAFRHDHGMAYARVYRVLAQVRMLAWAVAILSLASTAAVGWLVFGG